MSINVLYVEDEPALAQIVSESLQTRGYDVEVATDGQSAFDTFKQGAFDICVLDIMLPKMDGYQLAALIKEIDPIIPIIFLTAKTQTKDVIKGFEVGGRDYLRKAFSMEELIVRINNLIQSSPIQKENVDRFDLGKWTFYPSKYEIIYNDSSMDLSERESRVLHLLCQHMNSTCPRKEILMNVWGDDSFYHSRNLDVYINKLRKRFKEDYSIEIMTLKGVGYVFKVK